jgi:hypothetical protein
VLALPAERAIKRFFAGGAFFLGHGQLPRNRGLTMIAKMKAP